MVDSRYLQAVDDRGQTLIPPTLGQFAATFAGDLLSVLNLKVSISVGSQCPPNGVFLTLGDPADYRDKAGRPTSEGYTLTVNSTGIIIAGASPWGPGGAPGRSCSRVCSCKTAPRPPCRLHRHRHHSLWLRLGHSRMGDAWHDARYRPPLLPQRLLIEMCAYMSYFKQNTFHLHLSDNLFNNPSTRDRSISTCTPASGCSRTPRPLRASTGSGTSRTHDRNLTRSRRRVRPAA